MAKSLHHIIIGSGSAGFGAAVTLRKIDPACRISMVTMDSLPFYNRYDLPQIFRGRDDWHDLLATPPSFYEEQAITLRRHSRVVDVDGRERFIKLAHQESVSYDTLLVCAGGRSYVPENLIDSVDLMHGFGSFEAAMRVSRALPEGGTAVMIGGDMVGIDLALTLLDTGHEVTLICNAQTFWPHQLDDDLRDKLLGALRARGATVVDGNRPIGVSRGDGAQKARVVTLEDGAEVAGDVVIPFCGLVPSVEFMLRAGVDIERGLLVTPELGTTNDSIWAAGDVCQIWNDEEKTYKFYHGWQNVRVMGELAARNMCGAHDIFDVNVADHIELDDQGNIHSTFWTH